LPVFEALRFPPGPLFLLVLLAVIPLRLLGDFFVIFAFLGFFFLKEGLTGGAN
jgi:hypothetical protein